MVSISYVGPVCKGVHQPLVYVYASICEPDSVYWFSRYLCSKGEGVGSVSHGYMCILLYVKLIWCSGFPEIYAQLEEGVGVSLPLVYGHLGSFSREGLLIS